jgi:hypothetical protein
MLDDTSIRQLLETIGEFDRCGGASVGLIAWELSVEEHRVANPWNAARARTDQACQRRARKRRAAMAPDRGQVAHAAAVRWRAELPDLRGRDRPQPSTRGRT